MRLLWKLFHEYWLRDVSFFYAVLLSGSTHGNTRVYYYTATLTYIYTVLEKARSNSKANFEKTVKI